MRAHFKKALAFILLLTTVCSAFVGCFDLDDNGSYSDSDITDIATDGTSSSGTDKTDKTDKTDSTNE
jgi:hypothetical protein